MNIPGDVTIGKTSSTGALPGSIQTIAGNRVFHLLKG
jgi:hypothetical protein